jgi:predicted PurR-regulated permease PerM
MPKKIEISHRTIIFVFLFAVFLATLYTIKDIILELFLAILIAATFDPIVTKLHNKGVPRSLSTIVTYIIIFGLVFISVASIIPTLVDQLTAFVNNIPGFLTGIGISSFLSQQLIQQANSQIGTLSTKLASITISAFSDIFGILTVFVFSFYLLSQREILINQIGSLIGENKKNEFERAVDLVELRLGGWARGEIILMLVVGFANYVGLSLLAIPFAFPLAVFAGILEIVPYIGPVVAAIPAIVIGFGISPTVGLAVAALATLIQQLENYLFVPKIMEKNAGVNPIITLLFLAIGARLAGITGMLISVPVYISIETLLREKYWKESPSSNIE